MKAAFMALATILVSLSASAEVKAPGSFVPTACSKNTESVSTQIVAVSSVCLGKIVGSNAKAISLQINDGTSRQYVIETKGALGGMGQSQATFTGYDRSGDEAKTVEGILGMTSGITVNYRIQLQTSDNLEFKATLHPVFTTM